MPDARQPRRALVAREPLDGAYVLLTFRHPEVARDGPRRPVRDDQGRHLRRAAAAPPLLDPRPSTPPQETFTPVPEGDRRRAAARWPTLRAGRARAVPGPAGPAVHRAARRARGAARRRRLRHRALPSLLRGAARARAARARVFYGGRTAADLPVARAVRGAGRAARRRHRRRQPRPPRARDGAARGLPRRAPGTGRSSTPAAPTRCCTRWRAWPRARGLPAQVSLDPWMGCGVGTCLGCVVWMQSGDEPRPHYRCACTEGPVFDARDVVWPGEDARGRVDAAARAEAVTAR